MIRLKENKTIEVISACNSINSSLKRIQVIIASIPFTGSKDLREYSLRKKIVIIFTFFYYIGNFTTC